MQGLDPLHRKVATKEVNMVVKAVLNKLLLGQSKVGEQVTCEEIIKQNAKEYRGLLKAGDGDDRFKELLSSERAPAPNMAILNSQQNLSLQ